MYLIFTLFFFLLFHDLLVYGQAIQRYVLNLTYTRYMQASKCMNNRKFLQCSFPNVNNFNIVCFDAHGGISSMFGQNTPRTPLTKPLYALLSYKISSACFTVTQHFYFRIFLAVSIHFLRNLFTLLTTISSLLTLFITIFTSILLM